VAENRDYTDLIRGKTHEVDVDAFKQQGLKKVNVINATKINELIVEAVNSAIEKLKHKSVQSIEEDKAQVILESMTEFKRLVKENQDSETKKTPSVDNKLKQDIQALRMDLREIKEMLKERPKFDSGQIENLIKTMMNELEKSGAIRGGLDMGEEAGAIVAEAVIKKTFEEDPDEVGVKDKKDMQTKTSGTNMLSHLEKLKSLKNNL